MCSSDLATFSAVALDALTPGEPAKRTSPRGKRYFWLGGAHDRFCNQPDSDGVALENGFASLTPLQTNMTAQASLGVVAQWPMFRRPAGP